METYRNKFQIGARIVITGDVTVSFWITGYDAVEEMYLVQTEEHTTLRPMRIDRRVLESHCEPYTQLIKAINSAYK